MMQRLGDFCRTVLAIAYKETTLMRRSPVVMGTVIAQPIIFLLLFGFVLSSKPANVPWAVLDQSHSALSRRLIAELQASGYFLPRNPVSSYEEGVSALRTGDALALLVVPSDLAREAARGTAQVQILLDGADPIAAARVGGYMSAIAAAVETTASTSALHRSPERPIQLVEHFWFNPTLVDSRFLLISLAGMLLTNLCLSVASFGLVQEREEGTWEQTLALPVTVVELVIGKLVPNVVLCYGVVVLAIVGPGLLFGLWPTGSLFALAVLTLPFVLSTLAIGVFISTSAQTVAQAVFISVFAIMPSFVMSGVMMSYEMMPTVPRWVGAITPLRWYQIGSRRIMARGGGMDDVLIPLAVMIAMFAFFLALTRMRTKPRLG